MGKTIVEKILEAHSGKQVSAGEIVLANIDFAMAQDGTAPLVIQAFESLEGKDVWNPEKAAFVIDHNSPSPNCGVASLHQMMREFVSKHNIRIFEVGEGVCHVLIPENGLVKCGNLVLGADSHTTTYGALNIMACGVGSTDLAISLLTGKNWLKVPETMRVIFKGILPLGVFAKDMALMMVGKITAKGGIYRALEITGETIYSLDMAGRFTICNMSTEVGAKCGIMEADEKTREYLENAGVQQFQPVLPDSDAQYIEEISLDVSNLQPQVAKPHTVDNVVDVNEVEGIPVRQAFIGTCTNGRVEDFEVAARILEGNPVHKDVRLICTPGSRKIYLECLKKGIIEILVKSGACVTNPGCGPCVGTHQGVPADSEAVISTANRNFKGRMGNPNAFIYLASPATVAASSVKGCIADPRKFFDK